MLEQTEKGAKFKYLFSDDDEKVNMAEMIKAVMHLDTAINNAKVTEVKLSQDKNLFFIPSQKGKQLVKVRLAGKDPKTYLGIHIGDQNRGFGMQIIEGENEENNTLLIHPSNHNPAIFVPELGRIVYGMESWWGHIESEEDLQRVITDEDIENTWYVKMFREMIKEQPAES